LALLPILLVIGLWWQSDRIIDAVVDRIPVSWEERLGETTFAQITATEKIVSVGPAVQAVEAIGQRLISQVKSPYKLRLHVVDNPQVNAFALPGGHMVILTGLLRQAGSPEEVAGVLAHEVQHVVLRHSMRGLVQSLGWRAAFTILMGGTGPLSDMGEIASRLGSLKFGRDQETAADLGGLSLLHQAKVSPDGMIDFFNTLSGKEPGQIALLSTHPLSEERARRLQKQIRQMGEWPVEPFAISWPEVQAALERK
jgi:predicted Zn-dependent protease